MFNLGYKQVIINSEDDVTDTGAAGINIKGFGTFLPVNTADGESNAAEDAALGKYSVAEPTVPAPPVNGDIWSIKFKVGAAEGNDRTLSEMFSYGEILSMEVRITRGTLMASLVDVDDSMAGIIAYASPTEVVFQPGYEGYALLSAEVIKVSDVVDGTLSQPALTAENLVVTEVDAPSIGVGLGKLLEAEVRNATFDNIDPYGIQFGGSSAVDVRGKYTTHIFSSKAPSTAPGWARHDFTGYGDVNTHNVQEGAMFIVYVNEVTAPNANILVATLSA